MQHTHRAHSHCRVSFYAKLRFVSRTQRACSLQQFLRVIRNAQVGSTLVCKLYPARSGRAEDVVTAGLSCRTQQVLAVDILKLDTKLVTAMAGSKLCGLVYKNPSGMP